MVKTVLTGNKGLTSDSSIFRMITIVLTEGWVTAASQSELSSTALDIIQPDLASTIGETTGQSHSTYNNSITYYPALNHPRFNSIPQSCFLANTYLSAKIPVVCTRPLHQVPPRNHHIQFPRRCCCRSPHVQSCCWLHLAV